MSTLLTVGYGDIYPITVLGKCMAIIIAFLGVGVVAIPTGIISAGFVEQYTKIKTMSTYSEEANIPKGDTTICAGDRLVLGAEAFQHEEKNRFTGNHNRRRP